MPLSLLDMVGMLIRRTPIGLMRRAFGQVQHHRLPFTLNDLEAHHLAGGDVERVIAAALQARADGLPDDPKRLTAADLAGVDPREVVAHRYDHPGFETLDDLRARAPRDPQAAKRLAGQLADSVQGLRSFDMTKIPSIARDTVRADVEAALAKAREELEAVLGLLEEADRAALLARLDRDV